VSNSLSITPVDHHVTPLCSGHNPEEATQSFRRCRNTTAEGPGYFESPAKICTEPSVQANSAQHHFMPTEFLMNGNCMLCYSGGSLPAARITRQFQMNPYWQPALFLTPDQINLRQKAIQNARSNGQKSNFTTDSASSKEHMEPSRQTLPGFGPWPLPPNPYQRFSHYAAETLASSLYPPVARNLQLPSNDGAQANFHRGYNHSENFQPPPQVYGAIDELGRHTMYPSNPAVTQPTTTSSCPPTPARLCQLNGYVVEDDPRGVPNIFEDWEPSSTLIRPHQLHGYMGNGNLTGFNDIFEDGSLRQHMLSTRPLIITAILTCSTITALPTL
jgi:hypothetical protein